MPSVDLFAEDQAHELFASALLRRVSREESATLHLSVRSAIGGHGRALAELRTYQRAVVRGAAGLVRPDLLVVMIDANCSGAVEAKNRVLKEASREAAGEIVIACPDPHVERWFFADPETFARVVGVDQQPGRVKCERDRYKVMLRDAIARAGHLPTLGGLEFAQDLVNEMDLGRACRNEPSLAALVEGIRGFAQRSCNSNIRKE